MMLDRRYLTKEHKQANDGGVGCKTQHQTAKTKAGNLGAWQDRRSSAPRFKSCSHLNGNQTAVNTTARWAYSHLSTLISCDEASRISSLPFNLDVSVRRQEARVFSSTLPLASRSEGQWPANWAGCKRQAMAIVLGAKALKRTVGLWRVFRSRLFHRNCSVT